MSVNQEDVNARIFQKFDALTTVVNEMRLEIVELRTELRLRKQCPEPGLCLELKAKVAEHDELVQRSKGGWRVIAITATAAGSLVGIITHFLQNHS